MIVQRNREGSDAVGYAYEGATAAGTGMKGSRSDGRYDSRRMKRLSAIAAASIAVALIALVYGIWASLASRATLDAAGSDAQPVLTARVDIRAGDALDASFFETKEIPQGYRVQGALASDVLEGGFSVGDRRALVDIAAGTQITPSLIGGDAGNNHLAASIEAGMQAVTIAVDAETGLAGQLRLYDRVRVVAWGGEAIGEVALTTICARVRVVALGDSQRTSGDPYTSVTIEVTPSEADAVREAQYAGKVSLVLVSVLDTVSEPAETGMAKGESGGEEWGDVDGQ